MFNTNRTYLLTTGVKSKSLAVICSSHGGVSVIQHKTVVFSLSASGKRVIIQNGGWDTVSTRITINRALKQAPGFEGWSLRRVKGKTMVYCQEKAVSPFHGFMELKPVTHAAQQ